VVAVHVAVHGDLVRSGTIAAGDLSRAAAVVASRELEVHPPSRGGSYGEGPFAEQAVANEEAGYGKGT
jgi:hypothetical protein